MPLPEASRTHSMPRCFNRPRGGTAPSSAAPAAASAAGAAVPSVRRCGGVRSSLRAPESPPSAASASARAVRSGGAASGWSRRATISSAPRPATCAAPRAHSHTRSRTLTHSRT
eukprot:693355-Prymnesium_polylepis.2